MIYFANDKYDTTLSQGFTFGNPTLDVNQVPDKVPTIVTLAVGTEFEATYSVTSKTLSSLTGVKYLRGYAGNHDALTPITCLNNEEFINQFTNFDSEYTVKMVNVGDITYLALAQPGTLDSQPFWQCQKIQNGETVLITWADGDELFDNLATNLQDLIYS